MGKQKGRISKGGFPSRPTIGTFSPSITEHFLTGGDINSQPEKSFAKNNLFPYDFPHEFGQN
jgi:hypothetical protein